MKLLLKCSYFFAPFLILAFFSCKSDRRDSRNIAQYKYVIKPKKNGKYYYTLQNDIKSIFVVNDQEIENTKYSKLGFFYEVIQDSSDIFLIKIRYDKLYVKTNNNGKEEIMDSEREGNDSEPVDEFLGLLKGAEIKIKIGSKGEVLNIEGIEQLNEKVMYSLPTYSAEEKKNISLMLSQFVGPEFIKNNIAQELNIFPDSALHVGDRWSRLSDENNGLHYKVYNSFTVSDMTDKIVEIKSKSDTLKVDKSADVLGYNALTDFEGEQTTTYKINIKTGMLRESNSKTTLEGTVSVSGKTVPVKISIKKEILIDQIKD